MDLVEQLAKLQALKETGALTDDEFRVAKQRLLQQGGQTPPPAPTLADTVVDVIERVGDENNSLGEAANRYVTYQYNLGIIGAVVAVIVFIIFAIIFMSAKSDFDRSFNEHRMPFEQTFPQEFPR